MSAQQEPNFSPAGVYVPSVPWDADFARKMHAAKIAMDWLYFNPLIFDTETTGLDSKAEICEIAIIKATDGETVFHSLVKPWQPMPADAQAIHGITDAMLADAPHFQMIMSHVETLFHERVVIGYNVTSDLRMLVQSGNARMRVLPAPATIEFKFNFTAIAARCVQALYAYWYGEYDTGRGQYRWCKLTDIVQRHNLTIVGALPHRALADALLTRRVLHFIANYRPLPDTMQPDGDPW